MTTTSSSVQEQRQLAAQWRRRKALADALAGVVATLVSLWTFYPIDVWKTKLQAGVVEKGQKSNSISSLLSSGVLFKGLFIKTLHAASSSFAYFYLYSFIVSGWIQRNPQRKMSPAVRLSLSAIAAMLNTLLTLPLDVMASQSQAGSAEKKDDDEDDTQRDEASDSDDEREQQRLQAAKLRQQQRLQEQQLKMDQVWKELQAQPLLDYKKFDGEIFYDSCSEAAAHTSSNDTSFETEADSSQEEKQPEVEDDEQDNISVTVTVTTRNSAKNVHGKVLYAEPIAPLTSKKHPSVQSTPILKRLSTMDSITELPSLWKGLYPSLLLCSNPSIHYTVFDMAKSQLLQQQSSSSIAKTNLTMMEAFLLGLFAKFCATMATYPLIRAKVMLMVTHRNSMLATLMENYNQHGIAKGWYKGCSVQLLHTVLKSALLMMVKERIARTTHRLLVPPRPTTSTSSTGPAPPKK